MLPRSADTWPRLQKLVWEALVFTLWPRCCRLTLQSQVFDSFT